MPLDKNTVDGPPTNVGLRRRTKSDHDDENVQLTVNMAPRMMQA